MNNIEKYEDFIMRKDEDILSILDAIILALQPLKDENIIIDIHKAYGRKDMVVANFILPENFSSDIRIKYIDIIKQLLIKTYPDKSNVILMLNYSASFDMANRCLRVCIVLPKK